jgi:hypothetical protein
MLPQCARYFIFWEATTPARTHPKTTTHDSDNMCIWSWEPNRRLHIIFL